MSRGGTGTAPTHVDGQRGEQRAAFAYSRLREAISSGLLPTGARLREIELADWVGVSRTPIRDALRRLESDGLISHAARRGLIVTELDAQQMLELYGLREALEGAASRLAARSATDADLASLTRLISRQRATRGTDAKILFDLNRQFHEVIHRASRNRYILKALAEVEDSLALFRVTTYSVPDRPAAALREHILIVDAIKRRDASGAEAAAQQHIQNAANTRLSVVLDTDHRRPGDVSLTTPSAAIRRDRRRSR